MLERANGLHVSATGRLGGTAGQRPADGHARLRDLAEQLRGQLTDAAISRKGTITLQVRPEKLGRVEVKLEFGQDNHVRALVTADTAEALEALKSDARGLERALQDAGLKTDDTSLSFQLRGGDGEARRGDQQSRPARTAADTGEGDSTESSTDSTDAQTRAAAKAAARGGVDVRI